MSPIHLALLLALPLSAGLPDTATSTGTQNAPAELEITYLANEGFLIQSPVIKVVIDGFLKSPYLGYESLTKEAHKQLTTGSAPFDGRILGLVSHAHRDHVQARVAARFLAANRGAAMVSSPQVLNGLAAFLKDKPAVQSKLFPIVLAAGESESFDLQPADASIQFMNLPHAGDGKSDVHNYAHLIRIGEFRVLHLGDAEVKRELFEPFDFSEQEIDVAFVPSWFFASAEGAAIIDEMIQPRITIACHIPPTDLELFTQRMKVNNPHVIVFSERMETRTFGPESSDDG